MLARSNRAGIERKILTSILWVGMLPIVVIMFIGYFGARTGQSNAVQENLLTAAEKTTDTIYMELASRLEIAEKLADYPRIVSFLEKSGELSNDDLVTIFEAVDFLSAGDISPTLTLYDSDRVALISNARGSTEVPMSDLIPSDLAAPQFCNIYAVPGQNIFMSVAAAPVFSPSTGDLIGTITIESSVNHILRYALGESPLIGREKNNLDVYEVGYIAPGLGSFAVGMKSLMGTEASGTPMMDSVLKAINDSPERGSGLFRDYASGETEEPLDVLFAYSRLNVRGLENVGIYFMVYRPAEAVFGNINLLSALALGACAIFIFFLCINAYREVHNNIVRPISLLNEGAQIIRQGDFDLKLKIGTGDEIEELSTSFNKMAYELSRNMQQLEDSEEKYRTLVTSMRDGIYQTDAFSVITFLNPAAVDILGFQNVDQAIGTNLHDMFQGDPSGTPFDSNKALSESNDRLRVWMRRRDGQTICVEMTQSHLFDDEKETVGIEGTLRDITTSVHLEKLSRERSERISVINQIANVINSSLEVGRLYESLVAELQKLVKFDYASVALVSDAGNSFEGRQLFPEEEVGPGHTFRLSDVDTYAARVVEKRACLVFKDLTTADAAFADQWPRFVRSCLCVPLYASGRVIGTLNLGSRNPDTYNTDTVEALEEMAPHLAVAIRNAQLLTNLQLSLEEVTRAREKLHEANEELKTLDELKTNLLSNVSHELRTPLVSVMGYTDMIVSGKAGPINKTQQEYLEISLRNVEKLVTLIENLLDFSRLHRGDERMVYDTLDLVDCVLSSVQMVKPMADSRGIKVELNADTDTILIDGDKGKLGQVFTNLLSNAVKFNRNGGRVDVTLTAGSETVEVVVQDTGIGIPQEALDKVFTRFYQYDATSTRKYGGTGIGLAIAQDIVRLHGSSINVSSEGKGQGSIFRFELPLAHVTASGVQGEANLLDADETHVLVELVSSDRSLSNQVREALISENMEMIHAGSSDGAFSLAGKYSPDCILVDLNTAEEAVPRLSLDATTADIPVIILTNDDAKAEEYQEQSQARTKRNFRKSSLLSAVHQALSGEVEVGQPIGHKVLCVDDDAEILRFVENCLQSEGYIVDTCASGQEALDTAASREYGLVLMDVAMPGMDGFDSCLKLKTNPNLTGIKVYLVTAKPVDRNISKVHECGADGFLLKPFHADDLLHLVRGLEMHIVAK